MIHPPKIGAGCDRCFNAHEHDDIMQTSEKVQVVIIGCSSVKTEQAM